MKKESRSFVFGLIVAVMMSTVAFAGGMKQTIEVVFNSVNLTVNGKKVNADTILYNGTTYVPLRATAEMLGKDVGWDQNTNTASINDKSSNITPPTTTTNHPIEVKESETGKLTVLKRNESVNITKQSGPFSVTVGKMQVSTLEVANDYKYMFDNKDRVTVVSLYVEVENKSKNTNTIYPDQGTITTNTKEQKNAGLFLSDNVGGDYIGEVIKKGNVTFLLDSEADQVSSFKYIISRPIDSEWNIVGEDIVFDLTF